MNYKAKNKEFLNYKVVYVPLDTNLKYPIYIPVVVNDTDILKSSGRLSKRDYDETIKLNQRYHVFDIKFNKIIEQVLMIAFYKKIL